MLDSLQYQHLTLVKVRLELLAMLPKIILNMLNKNQLRQQEAINNNRAMVVISLRLQLLTPRKLLRRQLQLPTATVTVSKRSAGIVAVHCHSIISKSKISIEDKNGFPSS